MSDRFRKIFRIPSTRLSQWNYSSNGYYFVTVCTRNMEHYFGEIVDGKMNLSKMGEIAKKYWAEIPNYFSGVELDEYVIMPNHMHGVIVINNVNCDNNGRDAINRVSTINNRQEYGGITGRHNSMIVNSISKIIRWYKGRTTFETRKLQIDKFFAWQPRFYDHIIRNDASLNRIREYIDNNPLNWDTDIENTKNNGRDAINRVSTVADYYKNII